MLGGVQESKELPNNAFVGEIQIIPSETKVLVGLVDVLS
jgi:hypothetical protein